MNALPTIEDALIEEEEIEAKARITGKTVQEIVNEGISPTSPTLDRIPANDLRKPVLAAI